MRVSKQTEEMMSAMEGREQIVEMDSVMEDNGRLDEGTLAAKHRRKSRWKKIVGVMACIVVFCTTYALILPAITLEKDVAYCGYEEHSHSADCYEQQLVCGLEEDEDHIHTDECYVPGTELICGMEEHTHTLSCYSNPDADVETAAVWEATLPEEAPTGVWAE